MTLLDVLLELLKPKKKTVAPEPVLPYGISAGYRGYTGRATTLVSGKGYFERQRSTQLLTEPSRVSGYFGVGRAVAAERREEVARIEQALPPTPTPYYIPTPPVTPYVPPTPTPTPTPVQTAAPTYIREAPSAPRPIELHRAEPIELYRAEPIKLYRTMEEAMKAPVRESPEPYRTGR